MGFDFQKFRSVFYTALAGVVITGLSYAADQRIDARIAAQIEGVKTELRDSLRGARIDDVNRQLQFYIIKSRTSGLTQEDQINKDLLEQQLKNIKEGR